MEKHYVKGWLWNAHRMTQWLVSGYTPLNSRIVPTNDVVICLTSSGPHFSTRSCNETSLIGETRIFAHDSRKVDMISRKKNTKQTLVNVHGETLPWQDQVECEERHND